MDGYMFDLLKLTSSLCLSMAVIIWVDPRETFDAVDMFSESVLRLAGGPECQAFDLGAC
jgi:hypothetical protein